MKPSITSQYPYSPLIWMFYGRTMGKRIHEIHERVSETYLVPSQKFMMEFFRENINGS